VTTVTGLGYTWPMLSGLRVLDLSDERGQLAGQTLADLGADVILVEPPGGSRSRLIGPFVDGHEDDPENSLWFWSYNRGKRSVVLDLGLTGGEGTPADRDRLLDLVRTADLVIDSAEPGVMAARGLANEDLAAVNPAVVSTSITAFGQDGPKANWHATDLTVVAAGVQMSMMGDDDRPPLRIPLDQAFLHASAEAAAASLIALRERKLSGRGQHVDVSAQQAILQATQSYVLSQLVNCQPTTRMSGGTKAGPFNVRLRSRASDGYVSNTILFGEAIGPFSVRLFEWIHAEGECTDDDLNFEWIDFVNQVMAGKIPASEYDRIQDVAEAFTAKRTKAELLEEALKRRLLLVPIAGVADVVDNEHYQIRDFWRTIEMPSVDRPIRVPGPMAKCSASPLRIESPPPAIGAHTAEVLADLERRPTVPGPTGADVDPDRTGQPLEGVKILDFMWVMAGPASTRVLADQGATVVRIESSVRVETARTIGPFLNDEGGAENSGLYNNMNAGKLGMTLDLNNPAARRVVEDLVRWADIVTESYSPKAMRSWGLTYEELRAIKPDIIVASTCLFGQNGPLSSLAGFGTMGASMSGFYEMTGWPDRDPAGVFGAYTDYIAPKYLSAVLLAALEHRDRTGEGQYIDMSQAEASMAFLAPAVLDYEVNGRIAPAMGNRHPRMAPHGAFPVAGDDRWIAIAVEGDEAWQALCRLAGLDDVADLDLEGRRAREDELEERLGAWTADRDPLELQELLQADGVAAHLIQVSADATVDPQLLHRNHFREVAHADHGSFWIEGPRFTMSRSTTDITDAGPSLGQHTFDILLGILGYDDEALGEVAAAQVLE
jgi:crotonobetainyl-CoA:carnitine CoA-transferase CaiB-like acyl-CoA transferase